MRGEITRSYLTPHLSPLPQGERKLVAGTLPDSALITSYELPVTFFTGKQSNRDINFNLDCFYVPVVELKGGVQDDRWDSAYCSDISHYCHLGFD